MRVRVGIQEILFYLRGDKNCGDTSACEFGEAAAGMFTLAFVPGDDDEIRFASGFKRGIEFVNLLFQKFIGEFEVTIMGGVTNIGGDEDEVGQVIRGEVYVHLSQRDNTALASFLVRADGVKENEGVMFADVAQCIASEAWLGHIILVGFPGPSTGFDEVGQAGGVDITICIITIV